MCAFFMFYYKSPVKPYVFLHSRNNAADKIVRDCSYLGVLNNKQVKTGLCAARN